MTVQTVESESIVYTDGTPVKVVPGEEAFENLRGPINEALRQFGLCVRFYWVTDEEGNHSVFDPPYAFFCERNEMDDETDLEQTSGT